MAWDASRPVNWKRLIREWAIYMAIMSVVFVLFNREQPIAGLIGILIISLPLYLGIGYVLAKLGFDRRRNAGSSRTSSNSSSNSSTTSSRQGGSGTGGPRAKPAPTKRTGGGGRPTSSNKRRR